jgi:hypothetical protein
MEVKKKQRQYDVKDQTRDTHRVERNCYSKSVHKETRRQEQETRDVEEKLKSL